MKLLHFFTLIFIIITFSCEKQTDNNDQNSNLPPNTLEVSNLEGRIGFWGQDVDKYTINVSVPGTIDSQITGIVDDLPEAFKTEGLTVIFSGKYETSTDNPQPIFGGQSVYSLSLSSIEEK